MLPVNDKKPDLHYQKTTTWYFVISVVLFLGVLLGVRCFMDYKREIHLLEERLMAQARVVDENLNTNISSISLILENIRREIDGAQIDGSNRLNAYLKTQKYLTPGILAILVIDSQGRCSNSSLDGLVGQNFSNRDYFITTRAATDKRQMFLSPPFKNQSGRFIITITKAYAGTQGEFKGVIAVSLAPEYFMTLLKSTIHAPDNRIALLHSDGIVFASIPEGGHSIVGRNLLKPTSLYSRHVREGSPTSIQGGRSYTTGDNRVFAYITNTPQDLRFDTHLVVAASRNLNEVLLPWKISAGIQLSVYLLLSAAIIVGTRRMLLRDAERVKSEERYSALFENAGDAIMILDTRGRIQSANRTLCKHLGYTEEELRGKTPAQFDTARFAALVPERMQQLAETGEIFFESEHVAQNGTVIPVEISSRIIALSSHTVIMSIVRDITMRKQMEEELHQALDASTASNLTMRRLLNTVAHEFRTPLSLLTSSTDILDHYGERLSKEQIVEQNSLIRSAARQMSSMIDSVISFNHTETKRQQRAREPLDVGRTCRAIAAEVATVWGAEHYFQVTIPADCGTALLDELLLRRVLENLLTNAFRYTPGGKTVSLDIKRDCNRLQIEIADQGIGIPDDDMQRIFDAFYRCPNVEARRGLGLGLSIVHEALTHMGGTITVESTIGKGTTMRVQIPVDVPSPPKESLSCTQS